MAFDPLHDSGSFASEMADWVQGTREPAGQQTSPRAAQPLDIGEQQNRAPEPSGDAGYEDSSADADGGLAGLFNYQGQDADDAGTTPEDTAGHGDQFIDTDDQDASQWGSDEEGDPYDVRQYIPEDRLNDDFVFQFGESKYKDWDSLDRGIQEKDRFISQLRTEREELAAREEEYRQQMTSLEAELNTTRSLLSNGRSDVDVDRLMATSFLPEDLRSVDPKTFEVSFTDFMPSYDEFVEKHSKKAPSRKDYDDDYDYREAKAEFDDELRRKFRDQESKADREYRSKVSEAQSQRVRYETAMAEAIARVKSERAQAQAQAQAAQETQQRRIREAQNRLAREVTSEKLGIVNPEDEHRFAQALRQQVEVNGQQVEFADAMILIESVYGQEPVRLMLQGLKSELLGPSSNNSRSRQRPKPQRPRPSSIAQARSQQQRKGAQRHEPTPMELAREAGFMGRR